MSTTGQKRIARKVADNTGLTYTAAKHLVSETITDLRIKRISYNENTRNWEISTREARQLIDMLTEQHATSN